VDKDRLLVLVEKEWVSFLASFENLNDELMRQPGVVGNWSVRDIIVHVTTWEEEALKFLPVIIKNLPVPKYIKFGGIDGFNALEQKRKQRYSLKKARRELDKVHQHLVDYLRSIQPVTFLTNKRFVKRAYYDTYGHYREHSKQVSDWRLKNEL
jgi:hypothetical protein